MPSERINVKTNLETSTSPFIPSSVTIDFACLALSPHRESSLFSWVKGSNVK
jgi:hypothetical protein